MKQNSRRQGSRVRYYHHQAGVIKQKRRRSFLPILFISAGFIALSFKGLGNIDIKSILPVRASNNIASELENSPEMDALSQSIIRANASDSQDSDLADIINDELSNFPKSQRWSVYVHELGGDSSATVNGDYNFDAGSLHKLFLLAPLESKIPAEKWDYYWMGGYNLRSCIDLTLKAADDACSQAVGYYINWDYADNFNKSIGFSDTSLGEGDEASTNVREVGQLLSHLKQSKMLSDLGQRQVFDSLYHQEYLAGLARLCEDCAVANKSSEQGKFVHDAGIVTRGQKSYVIAIMSEGGSFRQIVKIARVIDEYLNPKGI